MFVRNAINIPAATANVTAAADVVADRIVNINEKKKFTFKRTFLSNKIKFPRLHQHV